MLQALFKRDSARRRMAANHLGIIFEPFVCHLHARGHSKNCIHQYLQSIEHFGRWLDRQGVSIAQINDEHVDRFLRRHLPHCRCLAPAARSLQTCRSSARCLIEFLRHCGVVAQPPIKRVKPTPAAKLLADFDVHLQRIHGLSPSTRKARHRYAHEFLSWRFGKRSVNLRIIHPTDLVRYVNQRGATLSWGSLHALTVCLRSFFYFLEFTGRIRLALSEAVPCPAPLPVNQLPTYLERAQEQQLLRCFDRNTPVGRRNFAMALCLSELGLRAGEVAALTLDDVDWKAMTLRLRQTKQQRERVLPLPGKVARALIAYLTKGRPATTTRGLFVQQHAPLGQALKAHHVRSPIRWAFHRCGMPYTGTHILRHTWATKAHQHGVDLKAIADVLGHRSLDTASRYAHVDFQELRQAALPWPK